MNATNVLLKWDSFKEEFAEVVFGERMVALDLRPIYPVEFLNEDLAAMLCATIAALRTAEAVRKEFQMNLHP